MPRGITTHLLLCCLMAQGHMIICVIARVGVGLIVHVHEGRCLVRTMSHTSGYNRSRSLLCEGKRAYARIATVCVQSSGVRSGSVFL